MPSLLPSSSSLSSKTLEFPHRMLVTNIPLHISSEEFYDTLRSYTGGVGVHNALLIEIPLESNHFTTSATLTETNKFNTNKNKKNQNNITYCNLSHDNNLLLSNNKDDYVANDHYNYHHKEINEVTHSMNKRPREEHITTDFHEQETSRLDKHATRSTGAALVDFESKAFAEIVMKTGMFIEGNEVHWENVGSVIPSAGSLAAAQHYDAEKMRLIGKEVYNQTSMTLYNGRQSMLNHVTEEKEEEGNSGSKGKVLDDCCENHIESVSKERKNDEEIVRLVCLSREVEKDNESVKYMTETSEKKLINNEVLHNSNTDKLAQEEQEQHESVLYTSFDNAVRQITGKHIYSLEVLQESEAHITVSTQTAQLLREEKFIDVELCKNIFSDSSENNGMAKENKKVLRWKIMTTPRRRVDTHLLLTSKTVFEQKDESWSNIHSHNELREDEIGSNVKLCTKSEVMNAIAQLMSWSKGRIGALKDKYGNVLLLHNDLKEHEKKYDDNLYECIKNK